MSTHSEQKQLIREQAKKTRAMLHVDANAGEFLSSNFFDVFQAQLDSNPIISAYWPLGKECDTLPLIDDLLGRGYKVALPYINGGAQGLDFYLWDHDSPLIKSSFGAMHPDLKSDKYAAPVQPDIILLPLLAYDRRGNRLGYGAGHYDRYVEAIAAQGKSALLVGVAYMEQICLYPLPAEQHDKPLDCILNPNGYTPFSSKAPVIG